MEAGRKLSKRAERALEVLRAGGYWRRALETTHRGEKFFYRLYAVSPVVPWTVTVVKGLGYKTWNELEAAGLLKRRECAKSTTWPTEWEVG